MRDYFRLFLMALAFWWILLAATQQEETSATAPSSHSKHPKDIINNNSSGWTLQALVESCSDPVFCNPDAVLQDPQRIQNLLDAYNNDAQTSSDNEDPSGWTDDATSTSTTKFGVVVVRKMVLGQSAQDLSTSLFDSWRYGENGVLVFLAIEDRSLYITRGDALERILTTERLESVIQQMKPKLRNEQYDDAVIQSVEALHQIIAARNTLTELFQLGFFWSIVFFIILGGRFRERRKREITMAECPVLEGPERERALDLHRQFGTKACPICLEDFEHEEGCDDNELLGTDGEPLRILRCGHVFDETCWKEWVGGGHGRYDQCPVCRESVASPCCAETSTNNSSPSSSSSSASVRFTVWTAIIPTFFLLSNSNPSEETRFVSDSDNSSLDQERNDNLDRDGSDSLDRESLASRGLGADW